MLSNDGNTVADIYTPLQVPYVVVIWSLAGLLGPIFGPVIGCFASPTMGWSWTIWNFSWLRSLILVIMFFFSPETSSFHERAKWMRCLDPRLILKITPEWTRSNSWLELLFSLLVSQSVFLWIYTPASSMASSSCGLSPFRSYLATFMTLALSSKCLCSLEFLYLLIS